MSTVVTALALKLADLAVTNTASLVFTKVETLRARKDAAEREAGLVDIINELVQEKATLVSVAQGLEQELSMERMTDDEMEYIGKTLVPKFRQVLRMGQDLEARQSEDENDAPAAQGGLSVVAAQAGQLEGSLEILETMLDQQTFRVMQLMGFNIRRALGEPLTETLRAWIMALSPDGIPKLIELGRSAE